MVKTSPPIVHETCAKCRSPIVITRQGQTYFQGKNVAIRIIEKALVARCYCPNCNAPYLIEDMQKFIGSVDNSE